MEIKKGCPTMKNWKFCYALTFAVSNSKNYMKYVGPFGSPDANQKKSRSLTSELIY